MNTCMLTDTTNLDKAADILKKGGLVASPTETVYGLCANALDEEAVKKIYIAKGRPSDNPLIVHISNISMLDNLVIDIPPLAQKLIDSFWPGPLTIVFKASKNISKTVTGGLDTVAVRFPSHPIMQKLIQTSNLPLAAPSANTSGKPSPTNANRVIEDLSGKIEGIIIGGDCSYGVESTVVDSTSSPATLLRPGGITYEMLTTVLGEVHVDSTLGHALKEGETPKAPGMKYTHYSPNADVFIVKGDHTRVINEINSLALKAKNENKKVGILATDETIDLLSADLVLSTGSALSPSTIASNLFETLRAFDDKHIDIVYSVAFCEDGIGYAIMNRLEKSAGYKIINV